MNRVPDRFGFQALQAEMPEMRVSGIYFAVSGDFQALRLGGKLMGIRRDNQPVKPLHVVVMRDELRSQIVEQLLVGRFPAKQSKIAPDRLQALPEVPTPDPVNGDPREQGIVGRRRLLLSRLAVDRAQTVQQRAAVRPGLLFQQVH
jgi:hypothetical protein